MRKAKVSYFERLEHSLVKIIQQKGADQNQPGMVRLLLVFLWCLSKVFQFVVCLRYVFYDIGILRRFRSDAR